MYKKLEAKMIDDDNVSHPPICFPFSLERNEWEIDKKL